MFNFFMEVRQIEAKNYFLRNGGRKLVSLPTMEGDVYHNLTTSHSEGLSPADLFLGPSMLSSDRWEIFREINVP